MDNRKILIVIAIILFILAALGVALGSFGPLGLISLGLASFAASHL